MRKPRSDKAIPVAPWRVPVALEDIGEAGQHFDLVADQDIRAGVSRVAGLRELHRLEANFDVTRHGVGGLRVAGRVSATVGQNCVVTLEPIANEVEEEIDLVFAPQQALNPVAGETEMPEQPVEKAWTKENWREPETLVDGVVDLGALAAESLVLGLDPYPRKTGAVFEAPEEAKQAASPFAALAQLTRNPDGR
jgi:uncharacterized metal-binding protein YceD (DUF177 family)